MVSINTRSRTEGRALRPYKGLEGFETLLEGAVITRTSRAEQVEMIFGERYLITPSQLSQSGYKLKLDLSDMDLKTAAKEASISLDDVDVLVFARDAGASPIGETTLVKRVSIVDLGNEISLLKVEEQKPRPMLNKFDGFDLQIFLILNKNIELKPLRPHQNGTILASGSIGFQVSAPVGDLQPTKLTDEVRAIEELQNSAWINLKVEDEFIDASSLASVLTVYVDEEILESTSRLPQNLRRLAEYLFTIPALTQVVYEASLEVTKSDYDASQFQESGNAVLNFLYQKVRVSEPELTREKFINDLKNDPARITTMVTATGDIRKKITNAMKKLMGEFDDLSGN